MRGSRHGTTGLPRDPAVYQRYCDARIAELRIELARTTGHAAWERRRDIERRIAGYHTVKEAYQEMAQ